MITTFSPLVEPKVLHLREILDREKTEGRDWEQIGDNDHYKAEIVRELKSVVGEDQVLPKWCYELFGA